MLYHRSFSKNLENKNQLKITGVLTEDVVQNHHFDMEYVLQKFSRHYEDLYENIKNRKFLEENPYELGHL